MRAPAQTIRKARHLRRSLSAPEALLWSKLRVRAPGLPAFRRQHPIGPYVLDFYCAKARLAIEIDGASHDIDGRPERDRRRDIWLNDQGVAVTRVSAINVMRRADEVVDGIVRLVESLIADRDGMPATKERGAD